MFEKRYAIYQATKERLEDVPSITENAKIDATRVRGLYVKLDEARSYFPPIVRLYLSGIISICEMFFTTLEKRENTNIDDPEWSRLGEEPAEHQAE